MHFFHYTVADFCSSFPMQMSIIWQSAETWSIQLISVKSCLIFGDANPVFCPYLHLLLSLHVTSMNQAAHSLMKPLVTQTWRRTHTHAHTRTHTHTHTHTRTHTHMQLWLKSHTQRSKQIHLKITIIQSSMQAEQWANIYQKHITCRCTGSLEIKENS